MYWPNCLCETYQHVVGRSTRKLQEFDKSELSLYFTRSQRNVQVRPISTHSGPGKGILPLQPWFRRPCNTKMCPVHKDLPKKDWRELNLTEPPMHFQNSNCLRFIFLFFHFFAMVFCFQNCSSLLQEKKCVSV